MSNAVGAVAQMLHALRVCFSVLPSENELRLGNHTSKPLTCSVDSEMQISNGYLEEVLLVFTQQDSVSNTLTQARYIGGRPRIRRQVCLRCLAWSGGFWTTRD